MLKPIVHVQAESLPLWMRVHLSEIPDDSSHHVR